MNIQTLLPLNIKPFKLHVIALIAMSLLYSNCKAQIFAELSNPQVNVSLNHPPGLGIKVSKIAFAPATGTCADQIVDATISDFVKNNVDVIDKANLNTILTGHSFTLNGSVDKTSAAALGKILGSTVLVFVRVQRCATQQDRLYNKETRYDAQSKVNYEVQAYISRTKVFLKLSVRTVDLATGRIFAAQSFDYSPEKSNKSYDGYPEYPASFDIQDLAFANAVLDIHKMYLPWTENRLLYFYNNKEFNLKDAYKALKDGDINKAFELSKQNLEECKKSDKVKDKILAHANYNLGMCYMLRNEYDSALPYFDEANKLKSGRIVTDAIADCQKAKSLRVSMQQADDKTALEAMKTQAAEEKNAQAEASNTLTNKNIIKMVQLKLPESVIIQKIKASKCTFDTTPNALATLTKSRVSEKVITVMIGK